jgi:predicted regulator of Ras-like GTPase activity (Roadblock/LC7/MglB family)
MSRAMLKSLFGELGLLPPAAGQDFAATTLLDQQDARLAQDGRLVDRRRHDLYVTGSPAQAMRDHLAATADDGASHMITLLDPGELWAPAVIKALSDATGQPIEHLDLRDQASARTLATIERTVVPRRGEPSIKLYRADLRAAEGDAARIPFVLMERSEMAAVIFGALPPLSVDVLLERLQAAVREPTWRCKALLFLLPPHASALAHRIAHAEWPAQLLVEIREESLSGSSAVWNTLLGSWDRLQPASRAAMPGAEPDTQHLHQLLKAVLYTDGVLGCAIAQEDGRVIAGELRGAHGELDLDRAAQALAAALRAQQQALAELDGSDPVDELVTSAGTRQYVLRPIKRHGGLFVFAALTRAAANLALVRLRLGEAEKQLG